MTQYTFTEPPLIKELYETLSKCDYWSDEFGEALSAMAYRQYVMWTPLGALRLTLMGFHMHIKTISGNYNKTKAPLFKANCYIADGVWKIEVDMQTASSPDVEQAISENCRDALIEWYQQYEFESVVARKVHVISSIRWHKDYDESLDEKTIEEDYGVEIRLSLSQLKQVVKNIPPR